MIKRNMTIKPGGLINSYLKGYLKGGIFLEENTLLERFINEKIRDYQEPQREGTPKGETIGFSKVKFLASLLMMTKIPQNIIAEMIEVSFGVVRNWSIERTFQDIVQKNAEAFTQILIKELKLCKGFFPTACIDRYVYGTPIGSFFKDAIVRKLKSWNGKKKMFVKDFSLLLVSIDIFMALLVEAFEIITELEGMKRLLVDSKLLSEKGTNGLVKAVDKITTEFFILLIKSSIKLLEKNSLSDKERKFILKTLDVMEGYLKRQLQKPLPEV